MHFKRIEINGFKSFAEPVSIEFTDGITCIVGPNGSGKSNVSDALRWVLGEQSPKSLRGGRMEDVIFAGTASRRSKGMAEVTLVIDNSSGELAIDFSEVAITRRMYRSGESEYMINRTPCRLRDIRDLIMDTGIGVEGYSIIGQGKIADIVSNKMESRREIFEEAAGIVKYRNRKEDAERKLDSASQNLARVNDIVYEIESRIGGLEENSKKAAEYLEIRDKYKAVEINIILRNIDQAEDKTGAVKEELEEIEAKLVTLGSERDSHAAEAKSLRAKAEELAGKLEELRSELVKRTEEIGSVESRRQLGLQQLDALKKDDERLISEIADIDDKLARQAAAKAELSVRTDELEAAAESSADRLAEAVARSSQAEDAFRQAGRELDERKSELLEASSLAAAARAEIQSTGAMAESLRRRLERLEEDEDEKSGSSAELEEKLGRSEEEKKALAKSIEELEAKEKAELASIAKAAEELSSFRKKISELRLESGRLSARAKLLAELENSYEGYSGSVRFMMKQGIKGIIGVLGDLISVPRGWELAIETELGNKMQNIVCEDDDTARRAIDLLKKNQAGRLTFLPVSSIRAGKPADVSAVENCEGFLGLASENVSCEKGGAEIVDYLLGRVVICDRIENAIKMSKLERGLRYVTLEGDIVNAAGAITGGSVKNNTASILSRKSERDELERSIEKLAKDIEKAEASEREASEERTKAEERLEQTRSEIASGRMDEALLKRSIEQDMLMLQGSREDVARRARERSELADEILAAEQGMEKARAEAAEKEARCSAIEDELEKLSERESVARSLFDEAKEAETAQRIADGEARQELRSAGDRLAAIEEYELELQSDRSRREGSLASNERVRAQISSFGEGAGQVLKEKEEEKKQLEQRIEDISAERTESAAKAEEAEQRRLDSESALYNTQMSKHDAELRLSRFDSQSEALKEKLWDEFEISYAQAAEYEDKDFVMSRGLREAREYRERMRAIGNVNIGAIEEYRAVKERYEFLTSQREDILKAVEELRTVISETDATIKARFKESFDSVSENFEEIFTELFSGGRARLSLENPEDPMTSAIEIEAQPSGKKLQNINLLSGGEKTMTAIALMFAVLKSKPTPFCIMDEVEAALDETNIDRFAKYLGNFKNTQFALITHQKATMEYADALYGVTMPEQGVSKLLSLRLGDDAGV